MHSLLENVDLLSPIRTSLVGQHMESAYCAAAQDYGTSSDRWIMNPFPPLFSAPTR